MKTLEVQSTTAVTVNVNPDALSKRGAEKAIVGTNHASKNAARRKFMAEASLLPKSAVNGDPKILADLAALNNGAPGALATLQADLKSMGQTINSYRFADGSSLLGSAANNDQPNAAIQLLAAGFDVNSLEGNQYHTFTLVMQEAQNPSISQDPATQVKEHNLWTSIALSMINQKDSSGNYTMSLSTMNPTVTAADGEVYAINGDSPLQLAVGYGAMYGQFGLIDALVARGVNVNIGIASPPSPGAPSWNVQTTPLFMAIESGNNVLVNHLLNMKPIPAFADIQVALGYSSSPKSQNALQFAEALRDVTLKSLSDPSQQDPADQVRLKQVLRSLDGSDGKDGPYSVIGMLKAALKSQAE